MILGLIFLLLPLGIYLALVALPEGRPALIGFVIAAVFLGLGWLSLALGIGPVGNGDEMSSGLMRGALTTYTGVAMAAGVAQLIRRLLPADRAGWLYPMVAFAILLAGGFPALTFLGV